MTSRLRLALSIASAIILIAAFLIAPTQRQLLLNEFDDTEEEDRDDTAAAFDTEEDDDIWRSEPYDDNSDFRGGIKKSKWRDTTFTANEPLMPMVSTGHALLIKLREQVDAGQLRLANATIVIGYDSHLVSSLFKLKESIIVHLLAFDRIDPCLLHHIRDSGKLNLYERLECRPLFDYIVDKSFNQLDTTNSSAYMPSLPYNYGIYFGALYQSNKLFSIHVLSLNERVIDEQIDTMLEANNMTRSRFNVRAGGAKNIKKFGFFVNGTLNVSSDHDPTERRQMVCSGDVFVMVNTRNRVYEPGKSTGYFNLGQYNKQVKVPRIVDELDYYLGEGIRNRGLLLSQPDFQCKLVGGGTGGSDSFLWSAFKSNMSLILKNSFPYLTLKQQVVSLNNLFDFSTGISQERVVVNNGTPGEYSTLIGFDLRTKLDQFPRITYYRSINSTAWSMQNSTQPPPPPLTPSQHEARLNETNDFTIFRSRDGWSYNVIDNIFGSEFSLNVTSVWSSEFKQHHFALYKSTSDKRHNRFALQSRINKSKNDKNHDDHDEGDKRLVAKLFIDDRKNADLTVFMVKVSKDWFRILAPSLRLDTPDARRKTLEKFRLPRNAYRNAEQGNRADHNSNESPSSESVLYEHKFTVGAVDYVIQERLQRCRTDRHIAAASIRSRVNCRPDGDDNDDYVRQLHVTYNQPNSSGKMNCYPYTRQVVLDRINSSLVKLNQIGEPSSPSSGKQQVMNNSLEGFVRDYLKLGFYCDNSVEVKVTHLTFRFGYTLDTIMAINESTSQHQVGTDGDDHDTLIDQYNWLLESVTGSRLAEGVLIDSHFEGKIIDPWWARVSVPDTLVYNQTYLHKRTFPYTTSKIEVRSVSAQHDKLNYWPLINVTGTIIETCLEPKHSVRYDFDDQFSGINSILHDDNGDPAQRYDFDLYTQTHCTNYNTTYKFAGYSHFFDMGQFEYERKISHDPFNRSDASIISDSSSGRLLDHDAGSFSYGAFFDGYWTGFTRLHIFHGCSKLVESILHFDVRQTPFEPWIKINMYAKKDLVHSVIEFASKLSQANNWKIPDSWLIKVDEYSG